MELRGLILYILAFACSFLPFCVYSYNFRQDGSVFTSKSCDCESVEFWLPKRANGASKLLSYEETLSNTPNNVKLLSKNSLHRIVRLLWVPKHCELKLDRDEILQGNVGFYRENIDDRSVEIWFKDDPLPKSCVAATLKCKLKSLCVGIETRTKDVVPSTQRKLLMFKTDTSEETFAHQPYGVLLSVLVFCSMVVLIALCGKAEKNSQESVARDSVDDSVKIISSEKVKSIPRTDTDNQEAEAEAIEIKVEDPKDLTTDNNSNNAAQPVADVDLSPVTVMSGAEKDSGKTSVDGAVFGKEKRGHSKGETRSGQEKGKEGNSLGKKRSDRGNEIQEGKKDKTKEDKRKDEKRKEKEIKSKDRNKDIRSKRSHTAPSEGTEPKPFMPKMRLSLKTNSSTSNAYEEPKVSKRDKKKSKKKPDSDSPLANSATPFAGDRRSFIHRELPKRPSVERDNPPPDSEEDNYEVVETQGGPPRSPVRLNVPLPERRGSDNDSDLYDSVDDPTVVKPQAKAGPYPIADDESDTYETVETKVNVKPDASSTNPIATSAQLTPELYESVAGVYDEPAINRQRSFSEATPGPSTSKTDAEQKAMSLGRQKRQEAVPTPPPLEHLKLAKESRQQAIVIDDIDPYTVTVKKGDRIIQETSVSMYPTPEVHREEKELSPEEKESMYAKVDKEKQKKDRMEDEMGEGDGGMEEERKTDGEAQGTVSVSVVSVEEHQYETMPRQKESGKMPQKKDSFDETEDFQPYEEVETKVSANSKQTTVFV